MHVCSNVAILFITVDYCDPSYIELDFFVTILKKSHHNLRMKHYVYFFLTWQFFLFWCQCLTEVNVSLIKLTYTCIHPPFKKVQPYTCIYTVLTLAKLHKSHLHLKRNIIDVKLLLIYFVCLSVHPSQNLALSIKCFRIFFKLHRLLWYFYTWMNYFFINLPTPKKDNPNKPLLTISMHKSTILTIPTIAIKCIHQFFRPRAGGTLRLFLHRQQIVSELSSIGKWRLSETLYTFCVQIILTIIISFVRMPHPLLVHKLTLSECFFALH